MRTALLLTILALCLAAASPVPARADKPLDALKALTAAGQEALDRLERDHTAGAEALAASGLTGDGASAALLALCDRPGGVDCAAVSPQGVMLLVEPPAYKANEGALIGAQPQVRTALLERRPTVSALFVSVEGVRALDVERPVERSGTGGGQLLGLVSILIEPSGFFGWALADGAVAAGGTWAVVQADGRILWSSRPDLVGLGLAESGLAVPGENEAARILAEPEGRVGSRLHWTSLTLYDAAWRLLVRVR